MARRKLKLTRPALKRQREALVRFERYLPMLKLKQQQLQLTLRQVAKQRDEAQRQADRAAAKFEPYRSILADLAGIDVRGLSSPELIRTGQLNVAGITVPVFEGVDFPALTYSLFATAAWVDRAIADLRQVSQHEAAVKVLDQQYQLLDRELTKIVQRVNLFEKVKIPESREVIRVIRIRLGDEMTAAVGRAKIAKAKIAESEQSIYELVGAEGSPEVKAG